MKRFIPFLLGAGMFLAAGAALAFSGTHSFLNIYSVSSDGRTSRASYQATGSLPFNGQGGYDGSKVNLKGTLTVYEQDGMLVSPPVSYCLKLQGKLNALGQGKVNVAQYQDLTCKTVSYQTSREVLGYTEGLDGAFSLQYRDSAGVITTASGMHGYSR